MRFYIYGDVTVGGLSEINGTDGRMVWQWSYGFYPGCAPHQQNSGSEDHFDEAKAAFQFAWERLKPQITASMMDDWRADRDCRAKVRALGCRRKLAEFRVVARSVC